MKNLSNELITPYYFFFISRYKRLLNSLDVILKKEKKDSVKETSLVLGKPEANGKRKKAGKGGIENGETFSIAKQRKVLGNMELNAKESLSSLPQTVRTVLEWMKESMPQELLDCKPLPLPNSSAVPSARPLEDSDSPPALPL